MERFEASTNIESLEPTLAGLDVAIAWLRDHGVRAERLASLFGTNPNHIRQLVYRARRPALKLAVQGILTDSVLAPADLFSNPDVTLREILGIRTHEDFVFMGKRETKRLDTLEAEVESLATRFWQGVRFETGLPRFRSLLSKVGYPANARRIRLLARIRELMAETLLHSGRSASALDQGLRSLHLYRIAYKELTDSYDLKQIGRVARLVSQIHLLRSEPDQALQYLEIHRRACEKVGIGVRPEYHHQLGTVAFQKGDDEAAKPYFQKSMNLLADTVDYGKSKQRHEVLDIGLRHINLLTPVNWGGSLELLDYMSKCYPSGDIHVAINVNFTVACGFSVNSPAAFLKAQELLERFAGCATGFARQATGFRLLSITPALPSSFRADWVRFSLHQNALRNQ